MATTRQQSILNQLTVLLGRGMTAVEYEYQREIYNELKEMLGGVPDGEWSGKNTREAEREIMKAIEERGETESNEAEKKKYPLNWEEYCEVRDGSGETDEEGETETETNVDDRDAPNIYPYKKCCECDERKSCGNYREDCWFCEDCDAGECDECGRYLGDIHIFTYEKDGEEGVTVCYKCADEMDESFREQGYTRDDDEKETTPAPAMLTGLGRLIKTMCDGDEELANTILKTQTETGVTQFHTCDDCNRYCYTGGDLYPDGYTCADCDDEEEEDE